MISFNEFGATGRGAFAGDDQGAEDGPVPAGR